MSKIYVASSWRNEKQNDVVIALREAGHDVYDFKNPEPGNDGFHWSEIDPEWQSWTPEQYREKLFHPIAEAGFKSDFDAMIWSEIFVGVQPFGRSASLEMGWAAGNGKQTILLLDDGEPELMVKMIDHICCNIPAVIDVLEMLQNASPTMFRCLKPDATSCKEFVKSKSFPEKRCFFPFRCQMKAEVERFSHEIKNNKNGGNKNG